MSKLKSGHGTEIKTIAVSKLRPAEWNYKLTATHEQREKLKASILEDKSAGVLAVRHLGRGIYEVIDGNHRLEVIQELEWERAVCENFGKISLADAVLISRRRNTIWFESNEVVFGELLATEVLKEYTLEEIAPFMEESIEDLQAMVDVVMEDFSWENIEDENKGGNGKTEQDALKDYVFTLDQPTYEQFRELERTLIDKLRLFDLSNETVRRGKVLQHLMENK
jgi:hypothetical protein